MINHRVQHLKPCSEDNHEFGCWLIRDKTNCNLKFYH